MEVGLCTIQFISLYVVTDNILINNIKHLSQVNSKIDD